MSLSREERATGRFRFPVLPLLPRAAAGGTSLISVIPTFSSASRRVSPPHREMMRFGERAALAKPHPKEGAGRNQRLGPPQKKWGGLMFGGEETWRATEGKP